MLVGQDVKPFTVSIVVPNYNHGRSLGACIEAILGQKWLPDEVIVIDDASSDDSRETLARIGAREPRLKVLHNERNLGAIPSMNRGLAACNSHYVAFAAADDLLDSAFLSTAGAALSAHPKAALFCAEVAVIGRHADGRPFHGIRPTIRPSQKAAFLSAEQTRSLLRSNDFFIVTHSVVFRRDLLAAVGGFDAEFGSMADSLVSKELALAHGFCFVPRVVGTWYVGNQGLSRVASRNAELVLKYLHQTQVRIRTSSLYPPGYAELFERRWRVATCRVVLAESEPNWSFIESVGVTGKGDRAALWVARRLPTALARPVMQAWLLARWRPISIGARVRTVVYRAIERVGPALAWKRRR